MPNHMTPSLEDEESVWLTLPDSILLHIFQYLSPGSLLNLMQVCKHWHRVASDEFLWKDLFYSTWKINRSIPMAPGKKSWYSEFKRLYYHTPQIQSETVKEHRDQVLHVSFSHSGDLFATSSKDGYVKVWTATNPVQLKYYANMKEYTWKYTQFTQFNSTDTLLLVSGVHFGWQSTSGEIAVFNIVDGFELQCRVLNKPYDIFGTWYNDNYLLSGNLYWMGHLLSCSVLWLNKAYQDLESELESVVMKLYKFRNSNWSSIRTIMVADCLDNESEPLAPSCSSAPSSSSSSHLSCTSHKHQHHHHTTTSSSSSTSKSQPQDCTIEYNPDYHRAQSSTHDGAQCRQDLSDCRSVLKGYLSVDCACGGSSNNNDNDSGNYRSQLTKDSDYTYVTENQRDSDSDLSDESYSSESEETEFKSIPQHGNPCYLGNKKLQATPSGRNMSDNHKRDKYLVFTMGRKTYTPHQIGIKRIRWEEAKEKMHEKTPDPAISLEQTRLARENPESHEEDSAESSNFDDVDELIEMHGHIIGMALSPDHRYLYVNSRPWPKDAIIDNPLNPPPIAQEIDIHVVDIITMKQVGLMHRSHRAYTSDDECFFIFLDVCNDYVASGAEDKHGYLWDRHYGMCLTKFPHADVVNAVAFNPRDSEMMITVSDDQTFKVWRSRNRQKELAEESQCTDSDSSE